MLLYCYKYIFIQSRSNYSLFLRNFGAKTYDSDA